MNLQDAIRQARKLRGGWLFLPLEQPWSLDTEALVMELLEVTEEEEDADEEADVPPEARERGMRPVLSVADLRGVVENALKQRPTVSDAEVLEALVHYLERDSFREF